MYINQSSYSAQYIKETQKWISLLCSKGSAFAVRSSLDSRVGGSVEAAAQPWDLAVLVRPRQGVVRLARQTAPKGRQLSLRIRPFADRQTAFEELAADTVVWKRTSLSLVDREVAIWLIMIVARVF